MGCTTCCVGPTIHPKVRPTGYAHTPEHADQFGTLKEGTAWCTKKSPRRLNDAIEESRRLRFGAEGRAREKRDRTREKKNCISHERKLISS
jgi:hypothetical protein